MAGMMIGAGVLGGAAIASKTVGDVLNYKAARAAQQANLQLGLQSLAAQQQIAGAQSSNQRYLVDQQFKAADKENQYSYLARKDKLKYDTWLSGQQMIDRDNEREYQKALYDTGYSNQFNMTKLYNEQQQDMFDKGTQRYLDRYAFEKDYNAQNWNAKNTANEGYYTFENNIFNKKSGLQTTLQSNWLKYMSQKNADQLALRKHIADLEGKGQSMRQYTNRYGMANAGLVANRKIDTQQWVVKRLLNDKMNPDAAFDSKTTEKLREEMGMFSRDGGEIPGGDRSQKIEERLGEAQKLAAVEGALHTDFKDTAAPEDSESTKELTKETKDIATDGDDPKAKQPKMDEEQQDFHQPPAKSGASFPGGINRYVAPMFNQYTPPAEEKPKAVKQLTTNSLRKTVSHEPMDTTNYTPTKVKYNPTNINNNNTPSPTFDQYKPPPDETPQPVKQLPTDSVRTKVDTSQKKPTDTTDKLPTKVDYTPRKQTPLVPLHKAEKMVTIQPKTAGVPNFKISGTKFREWFGKDPPKTYTPSIHDFTPEGALYSHGVHGWGDMMNKGKYVEPKPQPTTPTKPSTTGSVPDFYAPDDTTQLPGESDDVIVRNYNNTKHQFMNREQYKKLFGEYPGSKAIRVVQNFDLETKGQVHDWNSLKTWINKHKDIKPAPQNQTDQTADPDKTKTDSSGVTSFQSQTGHDIVKQNVGYYFVGLYWAYSKTSDDIWGMFGKKDRVRGKAIKFKGYQQTIQIPDGGSVTVIRSEHGDWIPSRTEGYTEGSGFTGVSTPQAKLDFLPKSMQRYVLKLPAVSHNWNVYEAVKSSYPSNLKSKLGGTEVDG